MARSACVCKELRMQLQLGKQLSSLVIDPRCVLLGGHKQVGKP